LYFSLFYHVFYRITVIGWSALAVVSRYCQILLLLLLLLTSFWARQARLFRRKVSKAVFTKSCIILVWRPRPRESIRISGWNLPPFHNTARHFGLTVSLKKLKASVSRTDIHLARRCHSVMAGSTQYQSTNSVIWAVFYPTQWQLMMILLPF